MNRLFIDTAHKNHFNELKLNQILNINMDKRKRESILFIISANKELENKVLPYFKGNEFDYTSMLKQEVFPEELNVLVRLIILFFNDTEDFPFSTAFKCLDDKTLKLVLSSAYFYYKNQSSELEDLYKIADTNSYLI